MKKPELNITPFVDIMLVLLAILMVSITFSTYQEKSVNLPKGSRSNPVTQKATIKIIITKDNKIYINKKKFSLDNFIEDFNLNFGNYDKNSLVYIAADRGIKYGVFMKVYSAVVKNGFRQIGLLTQ